MARDEPKLAIIVNNRVAKTVQASFFFPEVLPWKQRLVRHGSSSSSATCEQDRSYECHIVADTCRVLLGIFHDGGLVTGTQDAWRSFDRFTSSAVGRIAWPWRKTRNVCRTR
jgi:hypothetical protein